MRSKARLARRRPGTGSCRPLAEPLLFLPRRAHTPRAARRYLHGNQLTGGLPAAWAGAESFSVLRELTLSENLLGGTLPMEWGLGPDAMPALRAVNLSLTGLTGTLPEQWGAYGGLASLERL